MRTLLSLALVAFSLLSTVPAFGQDGYDPQMSGIQAYETLKRRIEDLEGRSGGTTVVRRTTVVQGLSMEQVKIELQTLKTNLETHFASGADLATLQGKVTDLETKVSSLLGWFRDADGDGIGDSNAQFAIAVEKPEGYTARGGDCDDTDANVHPGVAEVVGDGLDNDCNNVTPDLLPQATAPVRSWRFTLGAIGQGNLHPGHYPSTIARNPDTAGAALSAGIRVPLPAGDHAYASVCSEVRVGYGWPRSIDWGAGIGFCAGGRTTALEVGIRAQIGYGGAHYLGANDSIYATGDVHAALGDLGLELSPSHAPIIFMVGVRGGPGKLRFGGSNPWAGVRATLQPYAGAVFSF